MGKKFKDVLDKYTFSIIAGLWAMGFLIAGFIVEPPGEIHHSVLTAVGEVFGYVAAVSGIKEWGTNMREKYRMNNEEE